MNSETGEIVRVVEGALLAAGRPLSLQNLENLFPPAERPGRETLRGVLEQIAAECEGRAVELREVAGGFRLCVREKYSPWVGRLWEERPPRYSRALLETLALVVYRQPVTRGEIEQVRGVAVSQNIIRTLLEREWVSVVGHREAPGRPALYATTRRFLDDFNLKSLDELPPLEEVRELTREEGVPELDFPAAEPAEGEGEGGEESSWDEDAAGTDESREEDAVLRDAKD